MISTPPCCFLLPKKPSSVSATLGLAYTPANTRPISVVNIDNSIVAIIFSKVLSLLAATFCFPQQRGFLEGRLIATNILDIDSALHAVAARHPLGALFQAASPSPSHEYVWAILSHIGVPRALPSSRGFAKDAPYLPHFSSSASTCSFTK